MNLEGHAAFALAVVCLWLAVLIAIYWHPAQTHCRCCPNFRRKGETK